MSDATILAVLVPQFSRTRCDPEGIMPEMEHLGARFVAGDPAAMTELYRRYAGAVTTVARSGLWSDDLVADAVQQTFVKAWGGRGEFDPDRPFAPWLYAIARRTVIDLVRSERRRQHPAPADDAVVTLPTELSDVWEKFEVRAALDELAPEEREVLRLCYFEGCTHAEAARVLGIPIGTIKSRSHRAHRRLSELLGHLVEEPFSDPDRMEGRA